MSNVQSIERTFLLLDALSGGEQGVTDLAHRTGLPKSTVARLLRTLEEVGAVDRSREGGRYRLGGTLTRLAASAAQSSDLIALGRPHLNRLARQTGEDAGISVADGYRVHYLDQVDADQPVQVRNWTGELIPLHVVPSGQVMLAHWPEESLAHYLARPLEVFTPKTETQPTRLRRRLAAIRRTGYGWGWEEFAEGINSVAAPVFSEGRIAAALHVHGPAYRFPPDGGEAEIGRMVAQEAQLLSTQLG